MLSVLQVKLWSFYASRANQANQSSGLVREPEIEWKNGCWERFFGALIFLIYQNWTLKLVWFPIIFISGEVGTYSHRPSSQWCRVVYVGGARKPQTWFLVGVWAHPSEHRNCHRVSLDPFTCCLVWSGDPTSWMGTKQQNYPFFHAETRGFWSHLRPQLLSHRDTPWWLKMQQLQDLLGGFSAKEHKLWILHPVRQIFFFKASFLGAVSVVSYEKTGFHPSSAVCLWVGDKWAQLGWVTWAGVGREMRDYMGKKSHGFVFIRR